MMEASLRIVRATPDTTQHAVVLLDYAMEGLGHRIFGNGSHKKALWVLGRLFTAKTNRFNYRFTFLAEKDNQILGLLLAFHSNLMRKLDLLTGMRLMGILRTVDMIQLVGQVVKQTPIKEAEENEYYISDLAVAPEFRNQKIGSNLLSFAEEQARKSGLKKCSLVVMETNEKARQLYLRHGYQIVKHFMTSRIGQRKDGMGVFRMVKAL
jgi:ribosomal protein S18 acetylase RimI-like enzyme